MCFGSVRHSYPQGNEKIILRNPDTYLKNLLRNQTKHLPTKQAEYKQHSHSSNHIQTLLTDIARTNTIKINSASHTLVKTYLLPTEKPFIIHHRTITVGNVKSWRKAHDEPRPENPAILARSASVLPTT